MSAEEAPASAVPVRMRVKQPATNGSAALPPAPNGATSAVLQRSLEALQEGEVTDEQEGT